MAASRGSSSSTNGLLPTSLSEQNQHDMDAGGGGARVRLETEFDDDAAAANDMPTDPFDIVHTKNAPHERIRCTMNGYDHDHGIFKIPRKRIQQESFSGERELGMGTTVASPTSSGDYGIALDQLVTLTRENNITALQQYGGVKGISALLKSNMEKGIHGDEMDVVKRKEVFGSNTILGKKAQSFWVYYLITMCYCLG